MATTLGVSIREIKKYEDGISLLGASRLKRVADALGVSVSRLFGGNEQTDVVLNKPSERLRLVNHPDAQRLLRAYAALDGKQQRAIVGLVETLRARHR